MRLSTLFFAALACLAFAAQAQTGKPEAKGEAKPEAKPEAVMQAKAPAKAHAARKARPDADARHCLAEPTTTAIIKCAEAYL